MTLFVIVFLLFLLSVAVGRWLARLIVNHNSVTAQRRRNAINFDLPPPKSAPPHPGLGDKVSWKKGLKTHFDNDPHQVDVDVIIIGSGPSALTLAALLGRAGKRCLVLEQHDVAGGTLHTFEEKGFTFDAGMHYVGCMATTSSSDTRFLTDLLTDRRVAWASMGDVFDVVKVEGDTYPVVVKQKTNNNDSKTTESQFATLLKARFPLEKQAIDRWFAYIAYASRHYHHVFLPRLLPDVASPLERLLYGISQWWKRLVKDEGASAMLASVHHHVTVPDILNHIGVRDTKLRAVLSYAWGDVGTSPREVHGPFYLTVLNHYLKEGGFYPVGGTRPITQALITTIRRQGGHVWVRSRVTQICVHNNQVQGVRVAKGDSRKGESVFFRAKHVVSTAGVHPTASSLLVADELTSVAQTWCKQLVALQPNTSHCVLFVGLNGTPESLNLPRANYWCFVSYKSLCDGELDGAAFISFPSAKDPNDTHAHQGKSTCQIIVPTHWATWADRFEHTRYNKRPQAYTDAKATLTKQMLQLLYTHFPQCKGHVVYTSLGTPLTMRHYLARPFGNSYGLACTPARFASTILHAKTPVQGLWLSGTDIAMPGYSGALTASMMTASVMLRQNLFGALQQAKMRQKARN